ncbi:MAG: hypothetical protein JWO46_190 [Nocardioidaceae bacterium]|nr:hypothetical protein [Nocardioidaceae bacterium]
MGLLTSRRTSLVAATPAAAWERLVAGGTGPHWYADAAPFRFRGALDRLLGGDPGVAPPDRALRGGDDAGFWHVESAARHVLVLRARVQAPGTVTLTSTVAGDGAGTRLSQDVTFQPRGVAGAAYLLADLPAREALIRLVHARTRREVGR